MIARRAGPLLRWGNREIGGIGYRVGEGEGEGESKSNKLSSRGVKAMQLLCLDDCGLQTKREVVG